MLGQISIPFEILILIIVILPIVVLIITIGLLIEFLRKYLSTKNKMFGFLTLLFATYLLYNFFQASQAITISQERAEYFFIMGNVLYMLTLYMLILVLEMYEKNIEFSRRRTIMTILIFSVIGGMLVNPQLQTKIVGNYYVINFHPESSIRVIQTLFYLIAGIWLISMLYNSRKAAWSEKQKKLITWLSLGVFLAILIPTMPFLLEILILSEPIELILGNRIIKELLQNTGMLIIGFAFLQASSKPWLLQRQRVFLVAVYDNSGIQLYSKNFTSDITSDDLCLLSGGFSAISNLFQEVTKTSEVKAILLEGKELRVINKELFICVILVKYSTDASELAHVKFSDAFEKKFSEMLIDFDGDTRPFEEAEDIASQYFS